MLTMIAILTLVVAANFVVLAALGLRYRQETVEAARLEAWIDQPDAARVG